MHDIFNMEHFYEYTGDFGKMKDRLCFFVEAKILNSSQNDTMVEIAKSDIAVKMLDFFVQLTQSLLDTYMIMLLTIEHFCGKPIVIPIRKLIKELHASIKELYTEKVLPHLHSCLKEILRTSIRRFEKSGFLVLRTFGNKKGSQNTFIQSPVEAEEEIHKQLTFLQSVRGLSQA